MRGKERLTVRVECDAGHRSEETPRRFYTGEGCIEVVDVLDPWLAPDHRYFKIRGDDDEEYVLRYAVSEDRWEITWFDKGVREEINIFST
ncbi:MAG: hypothetical protein ACE5GK_03455 [Nitrospiria bacterium]